MIFLWPRDIATAAKSAVGEHRLQMRRALVAQRRQAVERFDVAPVDGIERVGPGKHSGGLLMIVMHPAVL
jgi:hypothetical protein